MTASFHKEGQLGPIKLVYPPHFLLKCLFQTRNNTVQVNCHTTEEEFCLAVNRNNDFRPVKIGSHTTIAHHGKVTRQKMILPPPPFSPKELTRNYLFLKSWTFSHHCIPFFGFREIRYTLSGEQCL
jgi:hypothetical protein